MMLNQENLLKIQNMTLTFTFHLTKQIISKMYYSPVELSDIYKKQWRRDERRRGGMTKGLKEGGVEERDRRHLRVCNCSKDVTTLTLIM